MCIGKVNKQTDALFFNDLIQCSHHNIKYLHGIFMYESSCIILLSSLSDLPICTRTIENLFDILMLTFSLLFVMSYGDVIEVKMFILLKASLRHRSAKQKKITKKSWIFLI